jgi:transglutaminase-like putative cysteine protease
MRYLTGRKFSLSILFGILYLQSALAYDISKFEFGKISAKDFMLNADSFDSGASAVVLADIGNTTMDINTNGQFPLVFTRFMRIKILNKNGFDIGNVKILLFKISEKYSDRLISLKASTFNIENGIIAETKLDKKSIFNEKFNYNLDVMKFSLPDLKEGSIFDIEYTIKSPIESEPRPWSFQGNYPCLWNEYLVTIAPPLHYKVNLRGEESFDIDTTMEVKGTFEYREDDTHVRSFAGKTLIRRWVKRNVPALHEEPFVTTMRNYKPEVSFQLEYLQWNEETERQNYLATWNTRCKSLLADPNFGLALKQDDNWIFGDLKNITRDAKSDEEKAIQIFNYIRDNFKVKGDRGIYVDHSLKKVFIAKEGSEAEVNMLLTIMLRKAGIDANPLILSTRENGTVDVYYPLISEYNYVICVAQINDRYVTMDASQPYIGYGILPISCYNGYGHIVNEDFPMPAFFSADSIHESKVTYITIFNDDNGASTGSYKSVLGKYESYDVRKDIFSSSVDVYEKKITANHSPDLVINNFGIDSLRKYEYPLTVHYDFDLKNIPGKDILYFNPLVDEGYKSNPFKSMERHFPVEMPYQTDKTYVLNMEIPVGFQVDELPKSARVTYNNNEGLFEYLMQKGERNLQLIVRIKLNKANFPVNEYGSLRDFFAYVVKKESEQIVFKKIK